MEDGAFAPRIESCFFCRCGVGACRLFTSRTDANFNRQFYKCPEPRQCRYGKDGFFKWADLVRPEEFIDVRVPYCACKAGHCRVRRENGRILFTCTLKEGQGACGYRIFQDELQLSLRAQADSGVSLSDCNGSASPDDTRPVEEDVVGEKLEVTSPPVSLADCEGTASPEIWTVREDIARDKLVVTSPPVSLGDCNSTPSAKIGLGGENAASEKLEDNHWQSPPISTSLRHCDATTSTGGKNAGSEKLEDDKWQSPSISTGQRPKVHWTLSRKMKQLKFDEDEDGELFRSPRKRSRIGNKVPALSISANHHVLHLAMESMMVKQQWWMTIAIQKKLESQLQGWWGRLAFYALPKWMIPAASEVYVYDFVPLLLDPRHGKKLVKSDASTNLWPEFESVLLPDSVAVQNDKLVNAGASVINTNNTPVAVSSSKSLRGPGQNGDVEPGIDKLSPPHDVQSCTLPVEKTRINNIISESVSKVFVQAAEQLKNDLFTCLETMDINDHEAMVLAAEATYTALDRLGIDHQHLDKRVSEFISRSMTLAAVEQSVPKNYDYPQMELCYKFEKMKLDEMESAHTISVDTVMHSKNRLSVLHDLIDSAKEWLFQLEAEYLCSKLELRSMEDQLEKNFKEKQVLEGKYLMASKELEECKKVHEQREAAKAAFDRAKASLRG